MRINIEASDRICGNKYFPLVFVALAFLVVLLFSYATSPIYGIELCDSAVFKTMGHVLLNGGVPYVDYFDHKGPYLYLINAVGESLSPTWGLFLLQTTWLSVSLTLWFKTARLFVRPTYSLLILLFTTIIFIGVYDYGNLSEEWSLLPSSLCLYLAVSFLVKHPHERHQYWRSLVYGLCFGMVFLIRPNDAVMICGGVMTGIFLYIIFRQKQYINALVNTLAFFAGAIIMAAPWIAYFAYHHALGDLYFGIIGFNLSYSEGIISNLLNIWKIKAIVLLGAVLIIMEISDNKKELLWISVPIGIYILLFFGRRIYPHYFMTIVPCIFLLYFILLYCTKNKTLMIAAVVLLMLSHYPNYGLRELNDMSKPILMGKIGDQFNDVKSEFREIRDLMSFVPKEDRDSIWNYGDNFSSNFLQCGIFAQNPVPPIIAYHSNNFPKDRQGIIDISRHKPLWVFRKSHSPYVFPSDSAFIAEHYSIVKQSASTRYLLLKRKNK